MVLESSKLNGPKFAVPVPRVTPVRVARVAARTTTLFKRRAYALASHCSLVKIITPPTRHVQPSFYHPSTRPIKLESQAYGKQW
jgi:hypothetical protein